MTFRILTDVEHVKTRPQMYIGSISSEEKEQFVDYQWQKVTYVPGLFKIINELVDNSIDEYVRTGGNYADSIEIMIDKESFTIRDNGRGIPVELIDDLDGEKIYKPVAAWCRTKAGSNFGADEERETIGLNGVGSSLANIFSKKFIGMTADGSQQLVVECSGSADVKSIDVCRSTKRFTKVYCEPDFKVFGVSELDHQIIDLLKNRLENLSISYPGISFKLNRESIKAGPATKYIDKFSEENVIYHDKEIIIGLMNSPEEEFRYLSLVNGLSITGGGSHIDYIMDQLCSNLREQIKKKHKLDIMPGQIRSHIQLVSVIRGLKNMKFDSQTKEKITNPKQEVIEIFKLVDFDKMAKEFMKKEGLITPIIQAQLAKLMAQEARDAASAQKKLQAKKVPKHISATSRYMSDKILFITEGDSAIGQLITVRDPKIHGGYPIRGKIPNVHGMRPVDILKNKVLSEIMNVIGLKIGEPAITPDYGTIGLLQDGDVDGQGSIAPLLMRFFYMWPELYAHERIVVVKTPIIIATSGKKRVYFYTKSEYDDQAKKYKGWEIRYIKGLGTLRAAEYKDMINNPVLDPIVIDDKTKFDLMFGDSADDRKRFMLGDDYAEQYQ